MRALGRSSRLLLAAVAMLALAGRTLAADVYVIANGITAMTTEDIKEVFLGDSQFFGGQRVQPIDNAGAQADFLARVLNVGAPKYLSVWTKKAFRDGLNAPPIKATDVEVLAFVKSHPGAVGYITIEPQGVNVLAKF